MVFIRAPKIEHVGEGVEVIATEGSDPVAVRQGSAMAATFHPELSDDPRIHQAFLDLVGRSRPQLKLLCDAAPWPATASRVVRVKRALPPGSLYASVNPFEKNPLDKRIA